MCLDFPLEKKLISSVESREPLKCQSEKVHEEARLPPKPHWRDLVLICEPKNQTAWQKWHKMPVFGANISFELKHFIAFLLPKNSTRHTATSSGLNVENRDSENFNLFNHILLREDGEVPQKSRWLEN